MTSFAYTPGTRCTRVASARDAVERPRASGRSTRIARGHGGNTKREGRACRVRWGGGRRRGAAATSTKREGRACRVRWGDGRRRGAAATSTKREGRACRVRWGGRTPTGCGRDKYETGGTRLSRPMGGTDADGVRPRQARPSRVLDLYDNPIISRPLSIRSFPVPLQWVKQRASQPQNQSPCPRASARSVLTDRRPRAVPAPPRRGTPWGGSEPPAGQHGARGGTKARRISRFGSHTSLQHSDWFHCAGQG